MERSEIRRMKKWKWIILALLVVFCGGAFVYFHQEATLKDIPVAADRVVYDYEGLRAEAKVIAKVVVDDEASEEKSHIMGEMSNILGYYGERTVTVLEYYKDETALYLPSLTIIEPAALAEGYYFHHDGYETLKKGGEYILYLSDGTASGMLGIISADNGAFDLENLQANERFFDIAVKTIAEHDSELSKEQRKRILESENIELIGSQKNGDITFKIMNGEESETMALNCDVKSGETSIVALNQKG